MRADLAKVGAGLRCPIGICRENDFDFWPIGLHPAGQLEPVLSVAGYDANRLQGFLQYGKGLSGAPRLKNAVPAPSRRPGRAREGE